MDAGHALFARVLDEMVEQPQPDAAPLHVGQHADEQKLGFPATVRTSEKPTTAPRARSRARVRDTPAIGRIPLSCERVQASPKRSPKAASITRMTASIWSARAGRDRDVMVDGGGRHQAASRALASGARA